MAKQRTYNGQKKGQSLARQSRRSKVAGGGTGTGRGVEESQKRDNAFFKPGALKNLVINLIISAVVIAGLALAILVKQADILPHDSKTTTAIVVGCGVLLVIIIIFNIRNRKNGGNNKFFSNPFLK